MSKRLMLFPRLVGGKARLALALGALALAGCDRHMATGSIPEDFRERHPIHLVRGAATLEVFVGRAGGGLDRRQAEDVRGFAQDYMQNGEGPLVAYLPAGAPPHEVNAGLAAIRSTLAGGGAAGRLHIAQYHPEQPGAASIRLSFAKLKAHVPSVCTYEDSELIPMNYRENQRNSTSQNFGCAYQRNFAAQIADPRDLTRPRQEGPIDVQRRTAGIERIRKNEAQELKPGGKSLKGLVGE